jgi:hypothetical protein
MSLHVYQPAPNKKAIDKIPLNKLQMFSYSWTVTLAHSKANMERSARMASSYFRHSVQELHHIVTECPTHYRARHFINNSNTNKDIATKFEHN